MSRIPTSEELRRRALALMARLNRDYPTPDGWTDWQRCERIPAWAVTRNADRGIGAFLWWGRFLRFVPFEGDLCVTGKMQDTPEGLW